MRMLSLLFALAAAAPAQSVLTTTFANNNQGSPGGAIYFDLSADADVVINGMDLNFGGAGGQSASLTVYTTPGSSSGQQANLAAWTQHDTMTAPTTSPAGTPTSCTFDTNPLIVFAGTSIGVAVVNDPGVQHTYTTGTGFQLIYEECPLTLVAGTATNVPFTGNVFSPRVPNVNIHFVHSGDCGTVESFGTGCGPGAALQLAPASGRPVQGAGPTMVTATTSNIDASAVFHIGVVGIFDPAISLAAIGMPAGCTLYATPDALLFVAVPTMTPPSYTWNVLPIPALPAAASGFEFYVQATAFDAALTLATGQASNGLRYVVGTL